MAANSNSTRGIANFGKRLVNNLLTRDPTHSSNSTRSALRRSAHNSAYDKNFDDQVRPGVVPDDVIGHQQSDKYWAPHPQTGVFGPPAEHHGTSAGGHTPANGRNGSVLEEKAWFRPTSLEDLEKPSHH